MKQVEVYTSDTCIQCKQVKQYLKSQDISYIEHNISKSQEARKTLISMGYMSIPVLIIEGEHVLGFDQNRIELLLNK